MYIKKKLIAISLICAIAASFSACSDKTSKNESAVGAVGQVDVDSNATLSSEDIQSLQKQDLTIKPFNESADNQQDPVESNNSGDSSNVAGDQSSGTGNDSNSNNDNNSSSVGGNENVTPSIDASSLLNTTDVVIMPGGNNNNNDQNDSNQDNNNSKPGNKQIMQVWWLDLSKQKNFVFDGEFITADFKIKEGTANGTYPITVEWMDFSCWEGKGVAFNGTDGSVTVGSDAKANSFRNDGSPEIMIENASGKPGDTVTVKFQMKNNPGIVACIFRFGYDSDALEYVGGGEGADFEGTFS